MSKSNFWTKLKKSIIYILPEAAIIVCGLFLDLLSKYLVEKNMKLGETIVLIPKLLNFTYTHNERAAFGSDFGFSNLVGEQNVMLFFIIFTFVTIGIFSYFLFKKPRKGWLYRIAFALIISGAIGNLYDRIAFEYVRDFIQFEYLGLEIFGSTTFAIFNIADSCVVIGAIILMVFFIFFDETFKDAKPQAVQEAASDGCNQILDDKEHINEENVAIIEQTQSSNDKDTAGENGE